MFHVSSVFLSAAPQSLLRCAFPSVCSCCFPVSRDLLAPLRSVDDGGEDLRPGHLNSGIYLSADDVVGVSGRRRRKQRETEITN